MATIIVHGTFAREGTWWWDTVGQTFSKMLNDSLESAGAARDVWTIKKHDVSRYDVLQPRAGFKIWSGRQAPPFDNLNGRFRWSGADAHGFGRLEAGAELARYLEQLQAINPNERIDIVAHSHGCNVVKTATTHLPRDVNVGCIAFLACPHFANADGSGFPYVLNSDVLPRSDDQPPVVNLYSQYDFVQVDGAALIPDLGLPTGMPTVGLLGFPGTPMVTARRTDTNQVATHCYENFEPPSNVTGGFEAHSAMYDLKVALVIGQWFAEWPNKSFAQCWRESSVGAIGSD